MVLFFRRVRCLSGGALIDDIDYYNRVHEMMHICATNNNRENDDVEGFGYRLGLTNNYNNWTVNTLSGILANSSMNAGFKPLCGLLTENKFIPLMYYEEDLVVNQSYNFYKHPLSPNDSKSLLHRHFLGCY